MKKLCAFLSFLLILIIVSCTIGLGSAVDTEPPTLSISVPSPDTITVIRGKFPIIGTFKDDISVKDVKVCLSTASSDSEIVFDKYAELQTIDSVNNGKWHLIVDPAATADNISDGAYQITVTVRDNSLRTSTYTSQIRIDNTPPLIVLQRPGTIMDAETPDAYGRTFSVIGQSMDDNGVNLELKVYSHADFSDTNPFVIKKEGIPDTINIDFAKKGDDNYSGIYYKDNLQQTGIKNSYFELISYDNAVAFQLDGSQTEADLTTGNSSNIYYLYDDIADLISSYSITELYKIIKDGNHNTSRTANNDTSNILQNLNDTSIIRNKGSFSLSPDNNPTFTITGRSHLPASEEDYPEFFADKNSSSLTIGGSLQFEVTPSLDQIPLVIDSLVPYAYIYDSETGKDNNEILPDIISTKKNGSVYKIEVEISKEKFTAGKNYIIGIRGKDKENRPVEADGEDYGFHCAATGEGPVIKITKPTEEELNEYNNLIYKKLGDSFTIEGTVEYEDRGEFDLLVNSKSLFGDNPVNIENLNNLPEGLSFVLEAPDSYTKKYNFSYTIKSDAGVFSQTETETYIIVARASVDRMAVQSSVKCIYDAKSPEAKILNISPIATKYDYDNNIKGFSQIPGQYLNGNVLIKTSVYDESSGSGINEAETYLEYSEGIGEEADWKKITDVTVKAKTNEITLDTTKLCSGTAEKKLYLKIYSKDYAGNISEENISGPYIINQETDKPVILGGRDWVKIYESEPEDDVYDSTFTENILRYRKIYFTLVDDDGLANVTIQAQKKQDNDFVDITGEQISQPDSFKKNFTFYYTSKEFESAGIYKIILTVKDKYNNTSKPFATYFKITSNAPKISDVKLDNTFITTNTTNVIDNPINKIQATLKIASTEGPFTITYQVTKDDAVLQAFNVVKAENVPVSQNGSYSINIIPDASWETGLYNVQLRVTDKNGVSDTQNGTKFFNIDDERPVVSTIIVPKADGTETEDETFDFEVTATDTSGASSLPSKYWVAFAKCDDATGSNPQNNTTWFDATEFKSYSLNFANFKDANQPFNTSGYKIIYAYVEDAVGNKSEEKSEVFVYDTHSPEATINGETTFYTNARFNLSGTASDDWGIKTLTLKQLFKESDENQILKTCDLTLNQNSTWTKVELPIDDGTLISGTYSYIIEAEDFVGKKNTSSTVTVEIDQIPPSIEWTTPQSNIYSGLSAISGRATDQGLGVQTLLHKIVKRGDAAPVNESDYYATDLAISNNTPWRLSLDTKTGFAESGNDIDYTAQEIKYTLYEGNYTLYAKVKDRAGNVSSSALEYDFYVDQNAPEITSIKLYDNLLSTNIINYYKSKTSDSENIILGEIKETKELDSENCIAKLIETTAEDVIETPVTLTITQSDAQKKDGKYSFRINDFVKENQKDIQVVLSITLKDRIGDSGKELTYKYPLYNDFTEPEIEFLSPYKDIQGEESISGETYNFRATAADMGCGMESLKYLIVKSAGENDNGLSDEQIKARTDLQNANTTTALNIEKSIENELSEGKWFVYLYAKDKVGNIKIGKRIIWIDQENPELTINAIAKTGQTVNGVPVRNAGFTLSGTAYDANKIKANGIEIKDGDNTYVINPTEIVTETKTYSTWSKDFALGEGVGKLSEGKHNLIVTVTDKAGKKTSETRSVIIDSVAPNGKPKTKLTITSTPKEEWYDTQYINISVEPDDGSITSGIYKVEASSERTGSVSTAQPSWMTLTKQENGTYTGTIYCENQGSNTIKVKVTDNAGNTGPVVSQTVKIDTKKPDADTVHLYSIDSDTEPSALSGNKSVNGRSDIKIVLDAKDFGEAEDSGSGIKSVSLVKPLKDGESAISASQIGNTSQWEVTISKEKLASGIVIFTVTDNVDLIYSYASDLSITLDNTPPEVTSIILPEDSDKSNDTTDVKKLDVNGTINISGIVSDNRVVSQVDVSYYIDIEGKRTWEPCKQFTKDAWEFSIDTKNEFEDIDDGTPVYLAVVVTDDVGNCNLDTRNASGALEISHTTKNVGNVTYNIPAITPDKISENNKVLFYLNQNSDRPIITLDDLIFTNMDSSNYYMYGSSAISGTVDDDDGEVKNVWYNLDGKKDTDGSIKWEPLSVNNSSFMISDLIDGDHKILFKVQDQKDGIFEATAESTSDLMSIPVISDGNIYLAKNSIHDTTIYVITDDNPPKIDEDIEIKILKTNSSSEAFVPYPSSSLQSVGGDNNHNKFTLKITARDANKIKKITVSLDKNPDDPASVTEAVLTREIDESELDNEHDETEKIYRCTVEIPGNQAFDVSNLKSGIRSLTITAEDEAGRTDEITKMIKIVNESPAIRVVSHSEGDQEGSEFLLKTVVDGNENTVFRYQITKENVNPDADKWSENVPYAVSTRNIKINPRDVVLSFVNYIEVDPKTGLVVYKEKIGDHEVGERYKDLNLYTIHFYAEDELGNVNSTSSISLKLDPQGDIPVIKLTSPIKDSTVPAEYDSLLSGIVRIAGTVTSKNPIEGIYIQIDPQYDKTVGFNDENGWLAKTLPNAVDENLVGKSLEQAADYLGYEIKEIGNSGQKGIEIVTNNHWNFTFNKKSEFEKLTKNSDGTIKYDNNTIAIRLYAYDGSNLTDSENDVFVISLDAGAPRIGSSEPLYLRRYGWKSSDGNIYYTPIKNPENGDTLYTDGGCRESSGKTYSNSYTYTPFVKQYEKDMWLEGEWYLTASVEDESGISAITVNDESVIEELQKNYWNENGASVESTDKKTEGYVLNYRIGSNLKNEHGVLNYKISVSDNDAKSTTANLSIKYDNKKPRLEKYNLSTKKVYNKDGFYKVQSGAIEDDDESGFNMAVFFFKRTVTNFNYVYDTYRSYAEKDAQGNIISHKANAISYDGSDLSVPTGVLGEEGLYWKSAEYNEIDGSNVILATNEIFAHSGGLAKLDGVIYRIKSVNGTTVTLEGTPSTASIGNILFAIGHVVDKEGSESEGSSRSDLITDDECYGYYAHLIDDDGDKMIESVTPSDISTIWAGSINSNNIPDGSIELHYVVFDKAGNFESGKIEDLQVSNNAPRLAGLKVTSGADSEIFYNGDYEIKLGTNNYIHRATKLEKDCLVVSGDGKGPKDGGTAFMTVKDSIKFYPEIVGGNGALYYSYKAGEDLDEPKVSDTSGEYSFAQGWNDGIDDYLDNTGYYRKDLEGTEYFEGHYNGFVEFTSALIEEHLQNSKDNPTWFEYTIWDSTAGTTKFVDSLNVSFQCALWIEYFDDKKPELEDVEPLYWISETNNSLYKNSRKQGHIELKNNLTQELKDSFGETDLVSGKITMRGTASDNIRVSKLYAKVSSPNSSDTFLKKDTLVAEYVRNSSTKEMEWQSQSSGIETDGWECKVTDDLSVTEGHKVNWEFSWDTEKLLRGAEKNVELSFYVEDEFRGGKANSSGKKKYTVDVVPYITHVKTSLSNVLTNNPTVYDRTALGHYPVYSSETVTLEGFNLKNQTSLNAPKLTVADDATTKSHSAKYSITVNGITNINGLNNNELAYNKQPNGVNNDLLTDDIVFDVWQINSEAAKPTTTGNNGNTISQPVMKINPSTGFIGFAFVNGSFKASMSDGTNNSYQDWMISRDMCTSISFVYDSNGNSYGTIAGGDVDDKGFKHKDSVLDKFNFVNSFWGIPTITNTAPHNGSDIHKYNHSTNNGGERGEENQKTALRLESIGTQESNGKLIFAKQRVMSPALVVQTHDTTRNIYLAYYDSVRSQIRFRSGSMTSDDYGDIGSLMDCEKGHNMAFDGKKTYEVKRETNEEGVEVIYIEVGNNKITVNAEDIIEVDETEITVSNENSFQILADGNKAGSYVSLAVIPGTEVGNDTLIAVWYSSDRKLWYAYNTSPVTDRQNTSRDDETTDDGWSTPVRVFNTEAANSPFKNPGMYCRVAVDAKNGVHIAAYDPVARTLDYAYLDSSKAGQVDVQSDFKTMVVDANGVTGKYLTLDVAMDSSDSNVGTPYIGYYSDSCQHAKMAYLLNPEALKEGAVPGSNGKKVTGAWEITAVPTPSKQKLQSDQYNAINIGVWKNNGVLKESITKPSTDTNASNVYGNGTSNPVLGYAITAEKIETAQKL